MGGAICGGLGHVACCTSLVPSEWHHHSCLLPMSQTSDGLKLSAMALRRGLNTKASSMKLLRLASAPEVSSCEANCPERALGLLGALMLWHPASNEGS